MVACPALLIVWCATAHSHWREVCGRASTHPAFCPALVRCRGCTCVEQSVLGGVAHLLNFVGSGECLICAPSVAANRVLELCSRFSGMHWPFATSL